MRKNVIFLPILTVFGFIVYLLWDFTIKDFLPTALPKNYEEVILGQKISLAHLKNQKKPVFLHFFNPECPCSRFNLAHVRDLIEKYHPQIDFRLVLQVEQADYDTQKLAQQIDIFVPYLIDHKGEIAKKCGVYSTPQAVLLDDNQNLYYKGNYNKAKYCVEANSNFAQMAIDSLLSHKPSPSFGKSATKAYGCQLPQQTFEYEQ